VPLKKLEILEKEINDRLGRQSISSRVLLDRLALLDDASRKTGQYQDPRCLPFYYYLAKSLNPRVVLQVGLDIGLPLCCFLMGCATVEKVLAFQKRDASSPYSPRVASSNIKKAKPSGIDFDFYLGQFIDEPLESMLSSGFDVALVSCDLRGDELNDALYILWKHLNLDGFLVLDHMRSDEDSFDVFRSFCKAQSRDYLFFNTRYGNAVVRK